MVKDLQVQVRKDIKEEIPVVNLLLENIMWIHQA